jgi:hypothetical protein
MYETESTLGSKLAMLSSDFSSISRDCFEYWEKNFSPEAVEKKFLSSADKATATIGELKARGFMDSDSVSYHLKRLRYLGDDSEILSGFRKY